MEVLDLKITELQEKNMQMLIKFINVCNKYNINFFMWGGSLLGTIRHKDFIPWDDDVDIVMFRDQYIKFVNIIDDELDEFYEFYNPWKSKVFIDFVPCLLYKNSDLGSGRNSCQHNHLHLDIFILDKTFNNSFLINIHCIFLKVLYALAMGHRSGDHSNIYDNKYGKLEFIVSSILSKIGKIIPIKVIQYLYTLFSTFRNNKKSITMIATNNAPFCLNAHESIKIEYLKYTEFAKFHNIDVPIPNGWDFLLENGYGNYMILPPEEERILKHCDENWKVW